MARVLLYNFADEKRRRAVMALLFRFSIPCREVAAEEQILPLGRVLGLEGFGDSGAGPEGDDTPFTDEMMVMHDLSRRQFNGLLDGMKQAGVQVPLKAVVTPHNVGWSAVQLHRELRAEHETMARRAAENQR